MNPLNAENKISPSEALTFSAPSTLFKSGYINMTLQGKYKKEVNLFIKNTHTLSSTEMVKNIIKQLTSLLFQRITKRCDRNTCKRGGLCSIRSGYLISNRNSH